MWVVVERRVSVGSTLAILQDEHVAVVVVAFE